MNKTVISAFVLFITCTLLNAAPIDFVERSQWHLSIAAGGAFPSNLDFDGSGDALGGPFTATGEADLEVGAAIMIAGGYTWDNWRFELEYAYHGFDVDDLKFNTLGATLLPFKGDGNISIHTMMGNISYDWFFHEKWYWYNGVGLGFAIMRSEALVGQTDSDAAFAFQGMTGIGYEIMENLDIYWGYRFIKITDTEFTGSGTGITKYTYEFDGMWINQAEAGLRVRF